MPFNHALQPEGITVMRLRVGAFAIAGCLAVAALAGLSRPAAAQMDLPVDCGELRGSPFICLKNVSGKALTGMQVVAPGYGWFNPNTWISFAPLPPGATKVIKMPTFSHGDIQNVIVRSEDGSPHYFWNINVRMVTSIPIRW